MTVVRPSIAVDPNVNPDAPWTSFEFLHGIAFLDYVTATSDVAIHENQFPRTPIIMYGVDENLNVYIPHYASPDGIEFYYYLGSNVKDLVVVYDDGTKCAYSVDKVNATINLKGCGYVYIEYRAQNGSVVRIPAFVIPAAVLVSRLLTIAGFAVASYLGVKAVDAVNNFAEAQRISSEANRNLVSVVDQLAATGRVEDAVAIINSMGYAMEETPTQRTNNIIEWIRNNLNILGSIAGIFGIVVVMLKLNIFSNIIRSITGVFRRREE